MHFFYINNINIYNLNSIFVKRKKEQCDWYEMIAGEKFMLIFFFQIDEKEN